MEQSVENSAVEYPAGPAALKGVLASRAQGLAAAMIMLILSACGASSVEVSGDYPTPSVNALPLTLGVYYDDEFRDFLYTEYSETGKEEYLVASGGSHIELFDTLLPAMFDQVVEVSSPSPGAGVDAVFSPLIEEFQLALPEKTKLDVYEVWIKYNMRLFTPEGDYIADWVLTSYGRTPTQTFRSTEDAINQATVVALRDLGASFTRSFTSVPEVNDWLSRR